MSIIKRLVVSGYRNYELGIFQDNDEKVVRIKQVLRSRILDYINNGLEWIIIGGNLGTDFWTAEVVRDLKIDYPELQLALLLPHQGFGSHWNEANQLKAAQMQNLADYVNEVSHAPYQNPAQLRNHSQFLLQHSDGCMLLYDEEYQGKTSYLLDDAKKHQEKTDYLVDLITMYDLEHFEIF